jgi:catechol 2,3-dioxygenase-like lactoylglutathione lyase family enzyme
MRSFALVLIGVLLGSVIAPSFAQSDKVLGVNHVGIGVANLDEAIAFYTQKMGFREAFTARDEKGQPTLTYIQVSRDTFIELQPVNANRPAGLNHVGLQVETIGATVARLRERGLKIDEPRVSSTNSKITNVTDLGGVRFELSELTPDSLQRKAINNWK